MNTIPTAEEFYKEQFGDSYKDYMIVSTMIQFAKFHVQAALKAAADNSVKMSSSPDTIRNSYPLTNIK